MVEVYASSETGTWTIVVSNTAGLSCVVAAGEAFENLAEDLPPGGGFADPADVGGGTRDGYDTDRLRVGPPGAHADGGG